MQNPESISAAATFARVKYVSVWKGCVADFMRENPTVQDVYYKTAGELANALQLMEQSGATPVIAEDGKLAGNLAARIVTNDVDFLVVSKSGRSGGQLASVDDFCIVTEFCPTEWSLNFYAKDSSTLPTSDSTLHHAILHAAAEFHWNDTPYVSLHGHALETADKAQKLGIPCSTNETLFSTPDDMYELLSLLKQYPFPKHGIYVRKGHGFVVLGKTVAEAVETFTTNVMPFIKTGDGQ